MRRASATLSSTGQTAAPLVDNGKRVLDIDLQRCRNCGANQLKVSGAIHEWPVIHKILEHLGLDPQPPRKGRERETGQPGCRCAPCRRDMGCIRVNRAI